MWIFGFLCRLLPVLEEADHTKDCSGATGRFATDSDPAAPPIPEKHI